MPADPLTTVILILLSLLSAAGVGMAIARLRGAELGKLSLAITLGCAVGSIVLFGYRLVIVHDYVWQPLQAHVDGLILTAALLAGAMAYLQHPDRLPGVTLFGMPVLLIVLAWGVCASHWTLEPFHRGAAIRTSHLLSVYIGTASIVLAAVGGALYLVVSRKLKTPASTSVVRWASLERIERFIVHSAAIGFAALSVGLISGGVIMSTESTRFNEGWWHSPKLLLAAVVWLIYALVMTVRYGTFFRGRRAAWLSIAGLVALLAVWLTVVAAPSQAEPADPPTTDVVETSDGTEAR